jgi:hypothetical protein
MSHDINITSSIRPNGKISKSTSDRTDTTTLQC